MYIYLFIESLGLGMGHPEYFSERLHSRKNWQIALISSYLWYLEQHTDEEKELLWAVNCSHKFVSLTSGTTRRTMNAGSAGLWIALISSYLWHQEQLITESISGLMVVNCSHKFVSLTSGTTYFILTPLTIRLWIALISSYLWHQEQQPCTDCFYLPGCELLS